MSAILAAAFDKLLNKLRHGARLSSNAVTLAVMAEPAKSATADFDRYAERGFYDIWMDKHETGTYA